MRGVKLEREFVARQHGGDCIPPEMPNAFTQAAPAVLPLIRVMLMSVMRMFVHGVDSLHASFTAVAVADVPEMFVNLTRFICTASDCTHRHNVKNNLVIFSKIAFRSCIIFWL